MSQHENPQTRLTKGAHVLYRSSDKLRKPLPAVIKFNFLYNLISVEFEERANGELQVVLEKVTRQKSRDYSEGAALVWALVLTAESIQHSFSFESQDVRDLWDDEISTTRRGLSFGRKEGKETPGALRSVLKVDILDPFTTVDKTGTKPEGIAVWLKLELSPGSSNHRPDQKDHSEDKSPPKGQRGKENENELELMIGEDTPPDGVKRHIVNFTSTYNLLPSEGTSLYRLVKALRQRQQVLHDTQKLISEVQQQHLLLKDPRLAAEHPEVAPQMIKEIENKARESLAALSASLPERLGDAGPGAQFIRMVLDRNMEKLKVINHVIAQIKAGARQDPQPRPGTIPRYSPREGGRSPRMSPRRSPRDGQPGSRKSSPREVPV
mmetsp:Transcript_21492/g.61413  ORF Transcript_21492/g.61413 Transcript_21492/m.61413 type:complete len:380 (+) Transcript_21492:99-1238(+)